MNTPSAAPATALLLAVVAVSTSSLLVLLAAPIPALWIAAGRCIVTAIAWAAMTRPSMVSAVWNSADRVRILVSTGVAGAFLALHFGAWAGSLGMTTVLRANVLGAAQVVFAGLLAGWVGDRVRVRLYVGVAVVGLGLATVAGVGGSPPNGGDGLAVLGAAGAAVYLLVGRRARSWLPLSVFLAGVHGVAAAVLVLGAVISGAALPPQVDSMRWLAVLGCGLGPGLVGHGLVNWAVRRVPVHAVSQVLLAESVVSTALVVGVLGRPVEPREGLAATIVLAGIAIGIWPHRGGPSTGPGSAERRFSERRVGPPRREPRPNPPR